MGFEQLADLKRQLAAAREAETPATPVSKPPQAGKARPGASRPGGSERAAPAKTVDPVVQAIGRLQQMYPKIFPRNPAPKLPLKIGIHKDLVETASKLKLDNELLLKAIGTWCRGARYWSSIQENAVRVDLQGNEAGLVTANEAKVARTLEYRHRNKARPKAGVNDQAPGQAPATEPAVEPAKDA